MNQNNSFTENTFIIRTTGPPIDYTRSPIQ